MRSTLDARHLTGIAIATLSVLVASCGGEADPDASARDASTLLVRASAVERSDGYAIRESYAGRVASRRTSDLGFDRAGRVVVFNVDEGDRVEENALLARLETRDLDAELAQLQARLRATRSRLELARRTAKRRKTLADQESISAQAYDEAQFGRDALSAEVAADRAAIARVKVLLELSELRAPFPGTIVMRAIDEGTVATPGLAVLRLIEDGPVELRVGLPIAAAAALSPDADYPVEVEGVPHRARLHARLPAVDARTRTITTIFHIEDAVGLADGALARLHLETTREGDGFWLPVTALSEGRRGLWSAYALAETDADGLFVVERRDLQLVHVEADRAFVRGTLRAGDRIVMTGVHRIVPGQRVRAESEATAANPAPGVEG